MKYNTNTHQITISKTDDYFYWVKRYFTNNNKHKFISESIDEVIFSDSVIDDFIVFVQSKHDKKTCTQLLIAELTLFKCQLIKNSITGTDAESQQLLSNIDSKIDLNSDLVKLLSQQLQYVEDIEHDSTDAATDITVIPSNSNASGSKPNDNSPRKKTSDLPSESSCYQGAFCCFFAEAEDSKAERKPILAAPRQEAKPKVANSINGSVDDAEKYNKKFTVEYIPKSKTLIIHCESKDLTQLLIQCLKQIHLNFLQGGNNSVTLHYPDLKKVNLNRSFYIELNELPKAIEDAVKRQISLNIDAAQEANRSSCFVS